jgi:hypothetical protein
LVTRYQRSDVVDDASVACPDRRAPTKALRRTASSWIIGARR